MHISQAAGLVAWYSYIFKNFPLFVVIHTVKDFNIVNKAEVDVFLKLSCSFHDTKDVGNWISGSSAFSKFNLNIWKFIVHVLLKPGLQNFEHYFTSVQGECNYAVVWTFFVIAFLWDWNENLSFAVLWPLLRFPNLLAYWVKHFHSIIFSVQFSSVTQSCLTLCDPINCSTPGFPVHHQLPEFTQTHVHRVSDAIQPSHPLSSPSPPAPNPSQQQSLFQWVNSSHEVAKVLEFQLQHQSFQWTPRTDLL